MTKQILSQFEIEGGIGETSISITPDMNIKLKTIENDIFNSSDIQVKVNFSKKKNITVNIGKDNQLKAMQDCTVITVPYQNDNGIRGAIAVIGPTRMEYQKVIPLLDYIAKYLGKL